MKPSNQLSRALIRNCSLTAYLQHFLRARTASVAIEFAIVLPILIILLIGLIEFRSGFMVKQRTIVAATTMSNIVAEAEDLSPAFVNKLDSVARTILFPHEPAELDVSVAVVTYNGVALVVEWEESSTGTAFPPEVAEEMLGGLLLTSETAIISNVNVVHDSILGSDLFGLFEFNSRHVVYPDSVVSYSDDDGDDD